MTDAANANDPPKTKRRIPNPSPAALAYTPDEIAAVTPFSRSTVFELLKSGALPSHKKLGHRYVLRADLEAFLKGSDAA